MTLFIVLSCSKSTDEPQPDVYEVTTLASAKTNGLKEGMLSQVDLSEIGSLATDSKGNIYMADFKRNSLKKMTPEGKITNREIKGEFGSQSLKNINVSADDELQIRTLYQPEADLFYYAKNDDPIRAFANPFPKKGFGNSALTSSVVKKSDGKYLVAYDDKLYSFTNPQTYSDLKIKIAIGGSQLQGNISFLSSDEKLYYLPDGLYDDTDPFASLKYISKDYVKTSVKAKLPSLSLAKFNDGDGTLPNATIGRINIMCGDRLGNIYFIESFNGLDNLRLRKLSKDGVVTTLAGGILDDNVDGMGDKAGLKYVSGITVDIKGDIYISVQEFGVRKVSKKTTK